MARLGAGILARQTVVFDLLNHLLVLALPMMLAWPAVHDRPDTFHPGPAGSVALVLLALALIVALSALTYRFIEVPARRWLSGGAPDTMGTRSALAEPAR